MTLMEKIQRRLAKKEIKKAERKEEKKAQSKVTPKLHDLIAKGSSEGLTSSEAAELLGIDRKHVLYYADLGLLPVWRTEGKHRRFHVGEILHAYSFIRDRQAEGLTLEAIYKLMQQGNGD